MFKVCVVDINPLTDYRLISGVRVEFRNPQNLNQSRILKKVGDNISKLALKMLASI